jgi:transposase
MANRLKMATSQAVIALHRQGWSHRRIARELGIHRETVARYVMLGGSEEAKPATNPPPGSDQPEPALPAGRPANPPPGSEGTEPSPAAARSGPISQCEAFREEILAKLDQGLSGQRIWQDLVADHDFAGSYDCVKRFIRRLGKTTPLPYRRMECAPGQEAQVDFGTGAPVVVAEDKRRRTHVFRVVLSHSRKAYSESVFRQTTETFLQCLENAFRHFGGVPKTVVIDNLKAAVKKADWFDPELNPRIVSFCEHYGTVILPTKPYTPRHKGKVERGIDYVQDNGLKGRRFSSLAGENQHLLDWETSVADTRIHGTTRKQVGRIFRQVEQPALLPLPAGRFPFFHEAQRTVHRDGHVEVAKAYYSAPPEYVGRRVWVRWDGRLVRIFTKQMEQIAVHAQCDPGRFSTQAEHIDSRKVSFVERGTTWLLERAGRIGPHTDRWARAMLQDRGVEGIRVLSGLVHLGKRYRYSQIEQACEVALTHNAFRLRTIRQLIQRGAGKQQPFEFLSEHEIIRDLAEYDQLVEAALHREPLRIEPPSEERAS